MPLFKRRRAAAAVEQPAPVDPATQAGAAQLGRDSGLGMVPAHLAFTDPNGGGRVDMLGQQVVEGFATLDGSRTPESWYADRPLTGGVRTAPAFGEYIEEPGNTGGYGVITGRVPFELGPLVTITAEQETPETEFRVPPRPDVCSRVPQVGA